VTVSDNTYKLTVGELGAFISSLDADWPITLDGTSWAIAVEADYGTKTLHLRDAMNHANPEKTPRLICHCKTGRPHPPRTDCPIPDRELHPQSYALYLDYRREGRLLDPCDCGGDPSCPERQQ
jgi:hypothetical protein